MPGIASLEAFQRGVHEFDTAGFQLDIEPAALDAARRSLDESGLLLLGEVHGVRQNALIARELMTALDITGLALEWPAGLASAISGFFEDGQVPDHPLLWGGDGRITAGHFAMLWERFSAGRLLALTLFEGVNEVGWSRREAAMAERILTAQARRAAKRRPRGAGQVRKRRVLQRQPAAVQAPVVAAPPRPAAPRRRRPRARPAKPGAGPGAAPRPAQPAAAAPGRARVHRRVPGLPGPAAAPSGPAAAPSGPAAAPSGPAAAGHGSLAGAAVRRRALPGPACRTA